MADGQKHPSYSRLSVSIRGANLTQACRHDLHGAGCVGCVADLGCVWSLANLWRGDRRVSRAMGIFVDMISKGARSRDRADAVVTGEALAGRFLSCLCRVRAAFALPLRRAWRACAAFVTRVALGWLRGARVCHATGRRAPTVDRHCCSKTGLQLITHHSSLIIHERDSRGPGVGKRCSFLKL